MTKRLVLHGIQISPTLFIVVMFVLVLLCNCGERRQINPALNSPFINACLSGDENLVKTLWGRGAEVNAEEQCDTPLIVASLKGHKSIVRFLLKNGANPNLRNSCSGGGPLHGAALGNHPDIILMLIDAGSNVNVKDNRGETPLEAITGSARHSGAISMLKAYGAK